MRPERRGRIFAWRAWLSKGARQCPAAQPFSSPRENKGKAAGYVRRLPRRCRAFGEIALGTVRLSETLRLAVATHRATVAAVVLPHVSAIAAPALPVAEPGEHYKAMLLRLVEALVERASCISELLQTSSALAHHIGAQVKPLNRIFRAVCIGTRRKALRALLGEIAQRGLDRRPKFLLVGREL